LENIEYRIERCSSKMNKVNMKKAGVVHLLERMSFSLPLCGADGDVFFLKGIKNRLESSPTCQTTAKSEETNMKKRKTPQGGERYFKKKKTDGDDFPASHPESEHSDSDSDSSGSISGLDYDEGENEGMTIESLQKKMEEVKQVIKTVEERFAEVEKERSKAQREKNAFCSLKRSEVRASFCIERCRHGSDFLCEVLSRIT
jgi:hypothetical protein